MKYLHGATFVIACLACLCSAGAWFFSWRNDTRFSKVSIIVADLSELEGYSESPRIPTVPIAWQLDVEWYRRMERFDRAYQAVVHRACGWPEQLDEAKPTCNPFEGQAPDARQFAIARRESCRFFGTECE